MSKLFSLAAAAVLFSGLSFVVADDKAPEKVTIEGAGLCAKCALKETDSCQNVVIVTKDGKKTNYYLAKNDVAKKAHGSVGFCSASKDEPVKVKVEGTAEKKDDKWIFTATNITKVD